MTGEVADTSGQNGGAGSGKWDENKSR